MALLDEHITTTQAMSFSAFKGPFEERIDTWNETLNTVRARVLGIIRASRSRRRGLAGRDLCGASRRWRFQQRCVRGDAIFMKTRRRDAPIGPSERPKLGHDL